jgi:peptidoglycan/LPS O-acetylase OafA/YrhL
VPTSNFVHALTYTINYEPNRSWYLGHLWSLAVEEQFYLVWPATVLAAGARGVWRVALGVVCVVPLIRVIEATVWPDRLALIGMTFETTADALAIGCLLALKSDALFATAWYRRAVLSRWVVPALLIGGVAVGFRYRLFLLLGQPLIHVAIAVGIDRCVRRPQGVLGRVLNARPLVFVGTLSYSLYLWQQPFLNRNSGAAIAAFPLNLVLASVCALLSYYLVEQPALRVRPRVERMLGLRA